jgi:hypothetical protein
MASAAEVAGLRATVDSGSKNYKCVFPWLGMNIQSPWRLSKIVFPQQVIWRFGVKQESLLPTTAFPWIHLWMNGSKAFEMKDFRVSILKY